MFLLRMSCAGRRTLKHMLPLLVFLMVLVFSTVLVQLDVQHAKEAERNRQADINLTTTLVLMTSTINGSVDGNVDMLDVVQDEKSQILSANVGNSSSLE